MKFIETLSGYKTYIMAASIAVDSFGAYLGWWEESRVRNIVEGVLTVVFLRLGIEKSGPVK